MRDWDILNLKSVNTTLKLLHSFWKCANVKCVLKCTEDGFINGYKSLAIHLPDILHLLAYWYLQIFSYIHTWLICLTLQLRSEHSELNDWCFIQLLTTSYFWPRPSDFETVCCYVLFYWLQNILSMSLIPILGKASSVLFDSEAFLCNSSGEEHWR